MLINAWRETVVKKKAGECEDIGVYGCDPDDIVLVYAGDVYINFDPEIGYRVIIGNNQYSDDLPRLEEILYQYAVSEELLEEPAYAIP